MTWWHLVDLFRGSFTRHLRLTFRNEGSDEAGDSSHDVGGGEGKASANAFDSEEDEEGSRKFHQTWDEEVDVDISSQNAEPHDQTLVDHGAGEPGRGKGEKLTSSKDTLDMRTVVH